MLLPTVTNVSQPVKELEKVALIDFFLYIKYIHKVKLDWTVS